MNGNNFVWIILFPNSFKIIHNTDTYLHGTFVLTTIYLENKILGNYVNL